MTAQSICAKWCHGEGCTMSASCEIEGGAGRPDCPMLSELRAAFRAEENAGVATKPIALLVSALEEWHREPDKAFLKVDHAVRELRRVRILAQAESNEQTRKALREVRSELKIFRIKYAEDRADPYKGGQDLEAQLVALKIDAQLAKLEEEGKE